MKKPYRIPRLSKKQGLKNSKLAKIKSELAPVCVICGRPGDDLAHLLPKGAYPEHYTEPLNVAILCRECHNLYDNDIEFRLKQKRLYDQICKFDKQSADKYFKTYNNYNYD